jgi:hypothetical protein
VHVNIGSKINAWRRHHKLFFCNHRIEFHLIERVVKNFSFYLIFNSEMCFPIEIVFDIHKTCLQSSGKLKGKWKNMLTMSQKTLIECSCNKRALKDRLLILNIIRIFATCSIPEIDLFYTFNFN